MTCRWRSQSTLNLYAILHQLSFTFNRSACQLSICGSVRIYGLVINPEKSEAVLLSTSQQARISTSPLTDVNVAGCMMPLTDTVKILGVTIDHHLTFNTHAQNICKSSYYYYHIRALKHIRSSLTIDMAKTVACALVNTRLDYANAVLYGTSAANIAKLQRVQNALAFKCHLQLS